MPGCWSISCYHGYRTTYWRTSITTRRRSIHRTWVSLTSTTRRRLRSGRRGNSANHTCRPSTCPYCTNTATETVRVIAVIVGIIIADSYRSYLIDLKPAFRLIFWALHIFDHDSTWKLVVAGTMSSTQGLIRTILRQTFNCSFSDPISVKHGASVSMHKSTAMKVDDSTMLSPRTSSLTKKTRSVLMWI